MLQSIQMHLLWVMLYAMICFSCSQNKQSQTSDVFILDYNESESVPNIYLSEIADSIAYIPLSNDIVVGGIVSLDIQDSLIVLSDMTNLLAFNLSGHFQNKIGQKGQGPKEYLYSDLFAIDYDHDRVYIANRGELKVYSYDGTYLQTIKVPAMKDGLVKVLYMDSKLYLFEAVPPVNPQSNRLWVVVDTTGTVIGEQRFYESFPQRGSWLITDYTTTTNDSIIYWNQYNDTIFVIDHQSTRPRYIWTKGSYRQTTESAGGLSERQTNVMSLAHIFETPNFLFMHYTYSTPKDHHLGLFIKSNRRFYHTSITANREIGFKKGITNDMDGGLEFFPDYYATINRTPFFIRILQPESLLRLKEHPDKPFSPALRDLRQRIHEEDNPILMMVKLKQ